MNRTNKNGINKCTDENICINRSFKLYACSIISIYYILYIGHGKINHGFRSRIRYYADIPPHRKMS